jgi:hypothetical protein
LRGCSPRIGAISIAAFEEKSPNSALGGRSSLGSAENSWPATERAAETISARRAALGSAAVITNLRLRQ